MLDVAVMAFYFLQAKHIGFGCGHELEQALLQC
jgi:hypothetical protein